MLDLCAATTTFFSPDQVAVQTATGTTSDTISSEGYLFTYTRDKLFTGGVGLTNPIGRSVRIPWPQGVEAQAVTAGPAPGSARITLGRVDGAVFDLRAIRFRLLANTAGAGASLEIMPTRDGEDTLADPVALLATGFYGSEFSYDTTPNVWGSTAALTNADTYKITLYVDFAVTGLTLEDASPTVNHAPTDLALAGTEVFENEPSGTWVGSLSTTDPDASDTFTYALVPGAGAADNAAFSISGAELLTSTSFNFEVKSDYSIRIETQDQDLAATQRVFHVTVLDVDETPGLTDLAPPTAGAFVLRWSSVTNHLYTVLVSTNLADGFRVAASNLPATPDQNSFTNALDGTPAKFWQITTQP
jgi:hypothetical protein